MSTLSRQDIEKVAHLARLAMNEQEIPTHVKNLSNILQLVDQMNAVDTTNIAPMAHPLDIPQPLRHDAVTETNQRELFQSIAPMLDNGEPATKAGLYLVPKVIELAPEVIEINE